MSASKLILQTATRDTIVETQAGAKLNILPLINHKTQQAPSGEPVETENKPIPTRGVRDGDQ